MLSLFFSNLLTYLELSVANFLPLTGEEEGRPPGLVSGDSTRRRMTGPIPNSVNISKQKNPVTTDAALNKEAMVSCLDCTVSLGFFLKIRSFLTPHYESNVCQIMQLSRPNVLGQSSGSRRAAVSSSRDAFVGSDLDLRTRTTETNPGTAPKTSSVRNASHVKSYETAVKGIEGLQLENDEKAHY